MNIDVRQAIHPDHAGKMGTDELRKNYLVEKVFQPGEIRFTYSHYDRILFGGIVPTKAPLSLDKSPVLATEYFLQRREFGLINLGGNGIAEIDGTSYELAPRDGLYIGMGAKTVTFKSVSPDDPAKLYCVSTTAHQGYPTVHIPFEKAQEVHLGTKAESNTRTIHQYVHPKVLQSCQLAMGMTILEPENVWNTMPCHTHDRRMEVYFYFNMPAEGVVFHLMGQPEETRHVVMRNEQAIISPNWSIHSGVGTANYTFIWAMAGENQEFTDMDPVAMQTLK
jgi:4-deoxy-L-threo-5-hexosulose-uronate ketol-isomerase